MSEKREQVKSQLFMLRVWEEEVVDGRCEVRGQVKHILTGETSYFRQWPDLLSLLQQHLEVKRASEPHVNEAI